LQAVGIGKQLSERLPTRLIEPDGHEALCGHVRMQNVKTGVEKYDAGRQRIEELSGIVMRSERLKEAFSGHGLCCASRDHPQQL
jgi:hypothetical protein